MECLRRSPRSGTRGAEPSPDRDGRLFRFYSAAKGLAIEPTGRGGLLPKQAASKELSWNAGIQPGILEGPGVSGSRGSFPPVAALRDMPEMCFFEFEGSMFNARRAAALLLAIIASTGQSANAEPVRAMTFNIRMNTPKDGENAWPHRIESVIKTIREFDPDVLGVQEPQREQLDVLAEAMPTYSTVGVGRNADGSGEYSAIFYRRERLDLADAGVFWLSDTPDVPGSRTWGNTLPRICTWARLLDRTNNRRFLVLNTHWDHQSQPARLRSGSLIAERLQEIASDNEPAIVMGDFNCGEKDPAMAALCREGELFKDTFRMVHPGDKDVATFNGFGRGLFKLKIDAVLVTPQWRVLEAEIVKTLDDGRYPSDHYPVTAIVELPAQQSSAAATAP